MVSSNKFYEIALEVMLHLKPIASSNLNALEQFLKSYNVLRGDTISVKFCFKNVSLHPLL